MPTNRHRISIAAEKEPWFAIIASELVGAKLSRPGRSLPTILVLKFGEIRNYIDSKGRIFEFGECEILVEGADWQISQSTDVLANNNGTVSEIDGALDSLTGQFVEAVVLTSPDELRISLSENCEVLLRMCASETESSQWTFFRPERWNLSVETDGTLTIEVASKA